MKIGEIVISCYVAQIAIDIQKKNWHFGERSCENLLFDSKILSETLYFTSVAHGKANL